jgi:hypothetical protein
LEKRTRGELADLAGDYQKEKFSQIREKYGDELGLVNASEQKKIDEENRKKNEHVEEVDNIRDVCIAGLNVWCNRQGSPLDEYEENMIGKPLRKCIDKYWERFGANAPEYALLGATAAVVLPRLKLKKKPTPTAGTL